MMKETSDQPSSSATTTTTSTQTSPQLQPASPTAPTSPTPSAPPAFTQPLVFPTYSSAPSSSVKFSCLLCDVVENNGNTLLTHMVHAHSLVIADVTKIADLPKYLEYWKAKMHGATSINEYTSQIDTRAAPAPNAPVKSYFLLSDVLPEDRQLRADLQQQKLEEVLQKQRKERADTSFEKHCLFCSSIFRGDRNQLIAHMFQVHKFNIGRPDNLVDVGEFVDVLQQRLDNMQCLYCEKTYKSSAVLKQHMRKKKHFKLNPKNIQYDRFYVMNYLAPGKNWQELQKELDADVDDDKNNVPEEAYESAPESYTASGSELDTESEWEDERWDDWEDEEGEPSVVCLFCPFSCRNSEGIWAHSKKEHDFDLRELKKEWGLDYYGCVSVINCIPPFQFFSFHCFLLHTLFVRRCMVEGTCPMCAEKCGTAPAPAAAPTTTTTASEGSTEKAAEQSPQQQQKPQKPQLQQQPQQPTPVALHMAEKKHFGVVKDHPFFKDPQYLLPTYENDGLLNEFDLDDNTNNTPQEIEMKKKAMEDVVKKREQLFKELGKFGITKENIKY